MVEKQEIEYQLQQAYELLRAHLSGFYVEDTETGLPFTESEAYFTYEQMCEEAQHFIELFSSGFGWEAFNVLERAFPALAGHFAQRLTAFPAPVQRRLLQPVRWHDDPSAAALLRQLTTTSPHPDIRAFATCALAEAGH